MSRGRTGTVLVAVGDLVLFHLSFVVAFLIRFGGRIPAFNFEAYAQLSPWLSLALVFFFALYGLYGDRIFPWQETLYALVPACLAVFLTVGALSFMLRGFALPRSVFFLALLLFVVCSVLWRRFTWRLCLRLQGPRRLVLITTRGDGNGERLAGVLAAAYPGPTTVKVLRLEAAEAVTIDHLLAGLAEERPDEMIIDRSLDVEAKRRLLEFAAANRVTLLLVPAFYETVLAGAVVSRVDDVPVLIPRSLSFPPSQAMSKRLLDIVVCLPLVLLSTPFLLGIALAIVLESGFPVFYVQERLGQHGRTFRMLKFRTMRPGVEDATGPVLSCVGDPRVTRVGRFLRRTRLDELPQLWNVLKGEMSLVGPRPERPPLAEEYAGETPGYACRTQVKPGLTGWAQVEGKYSTPPADKLCFDLLYAQRYTPLLDLRILLLTLKAVLMGERAR